MNAILVKDLSHLRKLIQEGKHRFFIRMSAYPNPITSSKYITLSGDYFCIFNEIDGTDDLLDEKGMMNESCTAIGLAIRHRRFFCEF